MKKNFNKWILIMFLICERGLWAQKKWNYPPAQQVKQVDIYHGMKIPDPYRWLEDEHSTETKTWVRMQNEFTEKFFSEEIPFREQIERTLEALAQFSLMSLPERKGSGYVTWLTRPEWNQSVLYYSEKFISGWGSGWKEILNVNRKSEKGLFAPMGFALHPVKKILAYMLSYSGSDWNTIYFKNIANGKDFSDTIPFVQFTSLSWWKDRLVYVQAQKPDERSMYSRPVLSYSLVGRDMVTRKDTLLYAVRDSQRIFLNGFVTEDQRFLVVTVSKGTSGNMLKIKKLSHLSSPWYEMGDDMKWDYHVQGNLGDTLFILTNASAPEGRVLALDFRNPEKVETGVIWNARPGKVVKQLVAGVTGYVVHFEENVASGTAFRRRGDTVWNMLKIPDMSGVKQLYFDRFQKKFFINIQTFFTPSQMMELDMMQGKWKTIYHQAANVDKDRYSCRQVFFPARDGTKIPMFILSRKDWKGTDPVPAFVYGYGGFNISLTPSFSSERLMFLDKGGIYVIVNLRGGGEFGEQWHEAGTKCNKQNVFNDFMDAIDYLVRMKWTSYDKVAIHGRSNGGLLVGAVITQRPDICRVAVPSVGVLDMLRYQHFTVGRAWAVDYGLSENPDEFRCLIKYSPYHNVLRGERNPATLITTADHDDRVVPAHSYKFAASMQYHSISEYPVLIRIEKSAGHGAGKPRKQIFSDASYLWAFVFKYLNMVP